MPHRSFFVSMLLLAVAPATHAAPTRAQHCEASLEFASAKYAQCRLVAEQKYSISLDAAKRENALLKCSASFAKAFAKATTKYGADCAATEPSSAFETYLSQCADDVASAAGGASLPDYAGELASCNGDLATCESDLAACASRPPALLLKTGQTSSHGSGSDGDLQIGVAHRFVDNGDGTITDTRTGLMWEKKSDDGSIHDKDNTYTWCSDANRDGVCDGLDVALDGTVVTEFLAELNSGSGFAGYTDWRLPNRKELESLVSLEVFDPSALPEFDSGCEPGCTVLTCSCTASGGYWSSSTPASVPQSAWQVDFGDAAVLGGSKAGEKHVRAVRGGA
ncbi:MAG TPA: DUF1566 domain-containing protein [Candidatus Binatia bacterium]